MTNSVGLTAAEAEKLVGLIPGGCFVIGAGIGPESQLAHIRKAAGTARLVLAVIPEAAILPPGELRAGDDPLLASGAALAWLVRQSAPALAPQCRLNGVSGLLHADRADIAVVLDWLMDAPSVLGQMLALDGLPADIGPESR